MQKRIGGLYLIVGVLIVVLLVLSFLTFQKLPKPKSSTTATKVEPKGLNQQLDGKVKSYRNYPLEKKITLETKEGKVFSFNIQDSTIVYKCTDLANINSCTKTDQGIQTAETAQVLAKGDTALFILYK